MKGVNHLIDQLPNNILVHTQDHFIGISSGSEFCDFIAKLLFNCRLSFLVKIQDKLAHLIVPGRNA